MQCFNETSGLIEDCRIGYLLNDNDPNIIRRVAIVEGESFELGRVPANAYIQELSDPFWINDSDHLYLNADCEYGEQLRRWMTDYVTEGGQVTFEMIPLRAADLASAGLQLQATQLRAFQDGHPLWRRSVLSCCPGQGTKASLSTMSQQLRDALLSWAVYCEMMARHAMQIDSRREDSRFAGLDKAQLSNLARTIIERALGYDAGGDIEYKMSASELGIEELDLSASAHKLEGALGDGRSKYFGSRFSRSPKELTKLLRTELSVFQANDRLFGARFDASALVDWAATILINLRLVLTATRELDAKRDSTCKAILLNDNQEVRERLAREFTVEWLRGIRGEDCYNGEKRPIPLEDLLDLQMTALIAFTAGVNPRLLFPYINDGIYDQYDHDTLLSSQLLSGAVWLGEFFRRRYSHLDRYQAQAIVAFCNPDCLPRGLPRERQDEWVAATRLIVSFLTPKGLESLMEGANAVLNDGETRSVVAFEEAEFRAEPCQARIAGSGCNEEKAGASGTPA